MLRKDFSRRNQRNPHRASLPPLPRAPGSSPAPPIPPDRPLIHGSSAILIAVWAGAVLLLFMILLSVHSCSRAKEKGIAGQGDGDGQTGNATGPFGGRVDDRDSPTEPRDSRLAAGESSLANTDSGQQRVAPVHPGETPPPVESAVVGEATTGQPPPSGLDPSADSPNDQSVLPDEVEIRAAPSSVRIGPFTSPGVTLFGVSGKGRRIAFVVDCSSSMSAPVYRLDSGNPEKMNTSRFVLACEELSRAVASLQSNQTFTVILFNEGYYHESSLLSAAADESSKLKLENWIQQVNPKGGTDPLPALRFLFRKQGASASEVVYLLSDGDFDPNAVAAIRKLNRTPAVIHTISLGSDAGTLRDIASQNGGSYLHVQ